MAGYTRDMRRWLARSVVCLILGAITTVAVAVGGLQWFLLQHHDYASRSGDELTAEQQVRFAQRSALPAFYDDSEHRDRWYLVVHSAESAGVSVEQWDYNVFDYSLGLTFVHFASRTLTGWPARAFEHIYYPHPGTPARTERETIEALYQSTTTIQTVLDWPGYGAAIHPATVAPQGLMIDTLFYAAIWFGVFFGFTSAKRAIRRKRGRCPRCGYDLRGDLAAGCSECGWGR